MRVLVNWKLNKQPRRVDSIMSVFVCQCLSHNARPDSVRLCCTHLMMSVRSIHTVLFRPHPRPFACLTRTRSSPTVSQGCRRYATHRDPLPSSLLTAALDQKQRGAQRDESVGPFQLGVQPSIWHGEKVKKWSDLSTGGKGVVYFVFMPFFDAHYTLD